MLNNDTSPIQHATREFHGYAGAQYALPADDAENQRLLVQHNCLKKLFENRILLAPVTLHPQDRVLDVGTGPGLWVLDLARSVDPDVKMLGVDITSRLFPLSPPNNVDFQIESVTNLPLDWTDSFTLVHQRLLMLALRVPEWPQALREIYRVLQPGGYVQLGECLPWYEGEFPERPCVDKLVSAYRCLVKERNLDVDCAAHMQAMLEEVGFVDIHVEERVQCIGKWAGEDGVANAINHSGVFRGVKTPILEAGGYGKIATEAEYDALIEGQAKEWDEIPGTKREFFIFCARKPEKQ
ncbi:S-adenosyl-L-methionine-dependent methyltransferase [Mycena haematopus]|nr:S-adenosyl-L-methionine-dependent methyltransferase [Mycena haematopus]